MVFKDSSKRDLTLLKVGRLLLNLPLCKRGFMLQVSG